MVLNKETAAQDALKAVHHGMQFTVAPEDWASVRPALEAQATVWASEGVKPRMVAGLRAEIARHDAGQSLSNNHMIVLPVEG